MNGIGKAVNTVRSAINRSAAPQVLPDLCDIISEGLVSDGHSGQTLGPATIAENIPVEVSEAPQSASQIVSGGQTYQATHRLKFGYNETTIAIKPEYQIKIQARGLVAEFVLEKPVPVKGSFGPWLVYSAVLTTGFRSPANV